MYERKNEWDEMLKTELKQAVRTVDPPDHFKEKLHVLLESASSDSRRFGGNRMKRNLLPKVAAIVAVCAVAGGGVAYAAGGFDTKIASSHAYYDYENYDQIAEAEKTVGFEAPIPEAFSNGYAFEGITIAYMADADENGNKVNESKELDVSYTKKGMPEISMLVSKSPLSDLDKANPTGVKTIDGITVYYDNTEYLNVPADYQVSEKEQKREANDPHFEISYGSDKVETSHVGQVFWEKDGLSYMITSMDSTQISGGEMLQMAEDMIR